jgi:hypothetical protein
MSTEVKQGELAEVTNIYTKADGTAGTVEGLPVWTISNDKVGAMVVAPDGMSALVTWAGSGDAVIVESTADGDLGTGVFPIVISKELNFTAPLGAVGGTATVTVRPV